MIKDLTELVFILDRSGSMSGLEEDTIGGFNAMLEKQKNEKGEAAITTVLFDHEYELLHSRANIKEVALITKKDYFVRGSTALLDAVGRTIIQVKNEQERLGEECAESVMFVITTDGMENASKEFDFEAVRHLIEQQKERGWEFIFLGANLDAISTAVRFGIDADKASNYCHDKQGTSLKYQVINETVSMFRGKQPITKDWKKRIEEDLDRKE